MAAHETCDWTGATGKKYAYYVWPRHPNLNDGQMGNYIYSRLNENGQWVPLYIGQGDLAVRATKDHHRIDCIDRKGATHIHLRLNPKEADRLAEERDLLMNYTNSYAPSGCNVKIGG